MATAYNSIAVIPDLKTLELPAFSHYQGILNRMPFGAPPPDTSSAISPADAKTAAQEQKEKQLLARKLNMSCVNITPSGTPAVGFTDLSVKPAVNFYMLVGTTASGWTLKSANYTEEWAELEKDGTTIFVKLGQGLMAEPPKMKEPEKVSMLQDAKNLKTSKKEEQKPGVPPPPLFGIVKLATDPNMPPSPLPTPQELAKQIKVAEEIAEIRKEGGNVRSYRQRLAERQIKEQEKKRELEEIARQKMEELAQKVTAEELKKRERDINIDLIASGARPLSSIQLTEEEELILREEGMVSDHGHKDE